MINYIAIEPIAKGETKRGFSELEYSALDLEQGKRFWFDDHHELTDDSLSTAIDIEPFDNGAHLFLTIEFRRDNPHEVSVGTYCHDDSAELDHVILTATMGNYARLRKLRLARDDVSAADLWPDFSGDAFAPHRRFARDTLCSSDGTDVLLEAISDEADASAAQYSEDTAPHWKYEGKSALQY
jgi:hypothetical protein|tara:strand:+ start:1651 stop:2199 length:549 start_codon:yes stop_codon:yes gene_type:complete